MIALHTGDCLDVLTTLTPESVDSIVVDPPSSIAFMGVDWDKDRGGRGAWVAYWTARLEAAMRVLKPGHFALIWAIPRRSHWTATAVEDAGFEIRDVITHLFGQGYPKSKASLKPASEHWILARKPGPQLPLNIDACRIFTDWSERSEAWKRSGHSAKPEADKIAAPPGAGIVCHPGGRWPANVALSHVEGECELVGRRRVRANGSVSGTEPSALTKNALGHRARVPFMAHGADGTEEVEAWKCADDCPVRLLDEQAGATGAHGRGEQHYGEKRHVYGKGLGARGAVKRDKGGASRFFYCGKATRADRGEGNDHPTVKPFGLMRHLCRLVTPPGGTVLDLTMGSGSTGKAALAEGLSFIGIDLDSHNVEIARGRIEAVDPLLARSA